LGPGEQFALIARLDINRLVPNITPGHSPPPVGVTVVDIVLAIEVAINGVSDHGRSEVAWTYVNGLKS
jgi:hypothetical protein